MTLRLVELVAVAGRPRRAGADWTLQVYVVDVDGARAMGALTAGQ
jgi:hypothetical protein